MAARESRSYELTVGDVVTPRPGVSCGQKTLKTIRYVVAEIHDFRDETIPALYLTIIEEGAYSLYEGREPGGWSQWHAVVGADDVELATPAGAP